MSATPFRVAVMIATRNRRDDLEHTCGVLEQLVPPPDEILICADGCTDSTVEFLAGKGAPYRIYQISGGRGSIPNRDFMMREATAEIVLSLDDDSHPLEPDTIDRLRRLFAEDSSLAVASFPQRTDEFPETLTATDFGPRQRIASYASSSAALRRAVYLEVGGYESAFQHVYEEPDYALRCLAAGYQVRLEPGLTVRHRYTKVQRSEVRSHHFQARNEFWSVLQRCPFPQVLLVAPFRLARQFRYAWHRGISWVLREPIWWWRALVGVPATLLRRKTVPWPKYLAWMRLLGRPETL